MLLTWIRRLVSRPGRSRGRRPGGRPTLERLEDRTTPATHVWSGAASDLMSVDGNWSSGGHPVNGEGGPIVLVFPNTATRFQVTDDLSGLNVDQIQFTGAASNYVLGGAAGGVTLNLTGAVASQPNIDDQVGSNTFSAANLTLALTATNQINVTTGTLTVNSLVSGAGGIDKIGSGSLVLGGGNTYQGGTTLEQGLTVVGSDAALGDTAQGTAVSEGATLQLQPGINLGAEPLQLNGNGVPGMTDPAGNPVGALYSFGGNTSLTGSVTLVGLPSAPDTSINVSSNGGAAGSGHLTLNTVVSGGANLVKYGDGTLELAGAASNTYSGNTTVNEGTLLLNKANAPNVFAIGNGAANTLTIGDNIGGPDSDVVRFGAGGQLDPTKTAIFINESGLLDLNNFDTTAGSLNLYGGDLVTGTGTLTLTTDIAVNTPPTPRTATVLGNVNLGTASRTFNITKDPALNGGNGPELALDAVLSEPTGTVDGITKSGTGTLQLGGANTYTGPTVVNGGTLRVGIDNAIPSASAVSLNGGTLDLNNHSDTVGSLAGVSGTSLTLGTGVLTTGGDNTSTTFSGAVTGGASSGLTKAGTGIFQLAGNSPSYSGTTTVNGGTLRVNNGVNFSNSTFVVGTNAPAGTTFTDNGQAGNTTANSGGTLGGIGTVNVATVNSGAVLSPGGTGQIGTLTVTGGTNALTLNSGATYLEEINSAASFDKVNVTGSASLGGNLQVSLAQNVPVNTVFTILQTATGVNGTFSNLPEAATFVANNQDFTIHYNQGGNNAVTLTAGQLAPAVSVVSIQNGTATTTPSFGIPTTFTFTVPQVTGQPAPTGTVTFFVDGTQRGPGGGVSLNAGGQASISVPSDVTYAQFQGGSHTITANYSGDGTYAPQSASLTETVQRATSSTSVSGSPNPSIFGEPVTITATVTGTTPAGPVDPTAPKPTGLVEFFDTTTSTDLGTAPVDATGHAQITTNTFSAVSHTIRADYLGQASPIGPGDQNYTPTSAGNGSGTYIQGVNQGTTSTTVQTSKSPTVFGEPVTFLAHVTPNAPSTLPPPGSVVFVDVSNGNAVLGTSSVDPVTFNASVQVSSLAAGTHTIQANYTPPANTYDPNSAQLTQVVNAASTAAAVSSSPNPSAFGQPVTFTVTVTAQTGATPTGSVTLSIDNAPTATLTLHSGQAAFTTSGLSGGSHTVTATYTPDTANFTGSSTGNPALQQVVNPAPTTTALSASPNPAVFTQAVTFTATVSATPGSGTPTGSVQFAVDGAPVGGAVPLDASGVAAFSTGSLTIGSHTVTAAYTSSSADFTNSSGGPLTVTVRAQPAKVYVNPAFTGPAGSDPDGAGPATAIGYDAFPTIGQALSVVATGGTVVIAPATYPEALTLTRSVIVQGAGSGVTVLLGQPGAVGLNLTTASGVVLSGLTVRGFAAGLLAGPPTTFLSLTDVHISGNRFNSFAGGVNTVLVTGGPGDDTFFVTPGSLAVPGDNALGYSGVQFLTVDGGGGNNRLVAFLNDITTSDKVWVSAFAISRDTAAFRVFYRASGGTFAGGVVAVLGSGPETVIVQSQLAGAPTTIYPQGGDDIFVVAVTSASAYTNLTLDGGDGTDTLLVFDQSGGGSGQHRALPDGTAEFDMTYSPSAISRIHDQNIEQVFSNVPF